MKLGEAVLCMAIIVIAGFMISSICNSTSTEISATDMPQVAIEWQEVSE